jgi:hypothetical protein
MHEPVFRREALRRVAAGESLSSVSRTMGVERSTLRLWQAGDADRSLGECFRCEGLSPAAAAHYAALLGFYLGDGCVSEFRGKFTLRVSCDRTWPGIVRDVTALIASIHPSGRVHHVPAPGVTVVQSNWKHWPCLFPQHAPGRKHERPIVLEAWQREVVAARPADFLRGLFHSDGCRVDNWTRRVVAGEWKRYDYGRWQFCNASPDIRDLCCWALDLLGLRWRRSAERVVSVSRSADVARLDELIGRKS